MQRLARISRRPDAAEIQEFLVSIRTLLPPEMSEAQRAELQTRERAYAEDLYQRDTIHRIWRVPGDTASVGIWRAADATELHDRLAALPLFPWLRIDVRPLAGHFLETPPPS